MSQRDKPEEDGILNAPRDSEREPMGKAASRYSDDQIEDIVLMARLLAPDDDDEASDAFREIWYGPGRPDWLNSGTDFVSKFRRSMSPEELDGHLDEMKAAISDEVAAMWEREAKRQLAKKPRHKRNQRGKREQPNGR